MHSLCLKCGAVYDYSIKDKLNNQNIQFNGENYEGKFCPQLACNGFVIEVDELLIPIILSLNRKGYPTRSCCSGHIYDANSYITFSKSVILPNIPKNYIFDEQANGIYYFAKNHRNRNKVLIEVINNMKELIKWSENLLINNHWKFS